MNTDSNLRKYFKDLRHNILQSKLIVRNNNVDTFFIMSTAAAHMELFEENAHEEPTRYCSTQKVFSSKRLNDIGGFTLAMPFEVMMSVFHFLDDNEKEAIDNITSYLSSEINISRTEFLWVISQGCSSHQYIKELGVDEKDIIEWSQGTPFQLEEDIEVCKAVMALDLTA